MRKRVDPIQAKAKRQRKIVIAGAVVLVALLAFQLPRVLKQGETSEATPTTTEATAPAGEAPQGDATLASAVPTATKIPAEPDPAPAPQQGQLVSFSLFNSKDPFAQQLKDSTDGGTTGGETPPSQTPPSETPPVVTPPPATPPVETPPSETPPSETPPVTPPPASEPPPASTPAPAATAAKISVNGVSEVVKVGAAFPKANPLFRLVSIKDGVARIGVAGGSLQDGSATVPLREDEPLTLMNTADGTRYVIKLLSVS